jgi:hypothetical protein
MPTRNHPWMEKHCYTCYLCHPCHILRSLKDEIAEKYVLIAELSQGSAEMNKIFLALASAATKPATLSDDDDDESGGDDGDDGLDGGSGTKAGRFSRTKRSYGTTSATSVMIDDLLGSRTSSATGTDPTTTEKNRNESASSSQQKKNRLFNFMNRHRRASTGTAKKLRFTTSEDDVKRRPSRARRCVSCVRVCRILPRSVLTHLAC